MEGTILINNKLYKTSFLIQDIEGQKILKKARDEKQVTRETNIFCICNGINNPIPMHSRKNPYGNSYTLCRDPNTKHLHNPECIRYLDRIEEEEKNKIKKKKIRKTTDKVNGEKWENAYLFSNNYKIQQITTGRKKQLEKDIKRETTNSRYSQMYTILEKIIAFAWYKYVTDIENVFNPKEGNLFHYIYTKLDDMKILHSNIDNKKKNYKFIELKKLLFKPHLNNRDEDITNQLLTHRIFEIDGRLETLKILVIGKYMEHENLEGNLLKIKLHDPYLKNYYYIYGTKNQASKILKKQIEGASLYIIAYVIPDHGRAMIEIMDSMPILDNRGIYIESSYELKFAEELIRKNILFFRPPHSEYIYHHIFNKYIPDFILLDRKTRKFATICEVFGYKKDYNNPISKEYWENAKLKMKHYRTLRDKYNFYYWRAGDGYELDIWEPKLKKQ